MGSFGDVHQTRLEESSKLTGPGFWGRAMVNFKGEMVQVSNLLPHRTRDSLANRWKNKLSKLKDSELNFVKSKVLKLSLEEDVLNKCVLRYAMMLEFLIRFFFFFLGDVANNSTNYGVRFSLLNKLGDSVW